MTVDSGTYAYPYPTKNSQMHDRQYYPQT